MKMGECDIEIYNIKTIRIILLMSNSHHNVAVYEIIMAINFLWLCWKPSPVKLIDSSTGDQDSL
jgi:hypothetical protein